MSDFDWCKKCSVFGLLGTHRCPPRWDVLDLDNTAGDWDESVIVYAHDAREAAEKWAERDDSDSAEYSIVRGNAATVRVRPEADKGEGILLIVSGESVPSYHAGEARSIRCSRYGCEANRIYRPLDSGNYGDPCDCGGCLKVITAPPTAVEAGSS